MTIDRYTKAVLTVIAGCLLWQCAMTVARPVAAQPLATVSPDVLADRPQPVVIVGWGEITPSQATHNVKRLPMPVALPPNHRAIAVEVREPVRLASTPDNPLPVGLTVIKKTTDQWDAVSTQVLRQPPTRMPGQ